MSFLKQELNYFLLFVKVTPNSSKNKIGKIFIDEKNQQYLKINICGIPENGKANQELINFLSKTTKIPKSKIEILSGNNSRLKVLKIYEKSISIQAGA